MRLRKQILVFYELDGSDAAMQRLQRYRAALHRRLLNDAGQVVVMIN